ncbi:MAG TPA: HigA family addiction module antitoxin [Blastocatellia bacterium]|nr:HigA family addiction module antitoxin [Blastocatellia bacterium]
MKSKVRPSHPGELIQEILNNTGVTQVALAKALGVSRQTVSEVVRQRRPVSPDLSIRLSRVFPIQTPDLWLRMQLAVDIWDAEHAHSDEYLKIRPLKGCVAV